MVLAAGRKLNPWLQALGWTTGDVDRVKTKGHVPGPEKLVVLADKENVNLSWLLAGKGDPWVSEAPHGVRETAAVYDALTPTKRALMNELRQLDDRAATAAIELLKALKKSAD